MGGCSDDAFEYLRAWIVGQGEETWSQARHDPETLFLGLLDGAADPEAHWERIGLHDGEHLLYAAGIAHERLTGTWLPSRTTQRGEPTGANWAEDDLPARFPALSAALPDWWQGGAMGVDELALHHRALGALDAFSQGDHGTAEEMLEPIVRDPESWRVLAADSNLRVAVAYGLGMTKMLRGDVGGAAETLYLVEDDIEHADEVRRGLAQVELARGELDAAERLLDGSSDAARFDRILTAKLLWRRGMRGQAVDRARDELVAPVDADDHPWDVAGAYQQAGRILVDAGEIEDATVAARKTSRLLRGAPATLPLLTHPALLEASIDRQEGRPKKALKRLDRLHGLQGSDLAEWHRERARTQLTMGRDGDAEVSYRAAVSAFESAGERWEAETTRTEASGQP
jgi:tetratricopeptide (TPR) repeat protein